jgi:hypothetical protein
MGSAACFSGEGAGSVRKWFAFVVVLSSLLPALIVGAAPAAAANELQVTVRPGFDGEIRPGTWAPVEINLANSGPNVSGNVELSVQRRPPTQNAFTGPATVDYTVPVSIPEHSSKRFSTAVFIPPFFDQLQVRLTSGDQVLYKDTVTLQRIDPSQVSCGVLATDPTAFDALTGLSVTDGRRQPHVAYLDLPDLPTNPQLLGALDCLIVSDYSTRGLSELQQTALTAWVDNGGVLTIGTGPSGDGTLAGLPADLLPATPDGSFTLRSLGSMSSFFGASGDQPGPWLATKLKVGDGTVVVADESQPLLVVGRRGKGTVFLLALSLTQKPLQGWDGLDAFWGYVLSYVPVPSSVFSSFFRQDYGWGRTPREALTRGGNGAGPDAQALLLALVLFAIVVGPINLLIFSRLGRRELTLVTVPLLTIVVTAGAIAFATSHRQGDVVVNQVSILRTWDGSGIGLSHSYVGVFALHPQSYRLAMPSNVLLANAFGGPSNQNQGQTGRAISTVRVTETGSPEVQGLELQPGSLSVFSTESHSESTGKVQGSIVADGETLSGQVLNGLSSTIESAAVVAGGDVQPIGDLAPGSNRSFSMHLGSGSPVGFRDPTQIVDKLFPGSRAPNARHDVKYDVLNAAFSSTQSSSGQVELSGLSLIGWLRDPIDSVTDPDTGRASQQQTLFITNLPIQISGQVQTIPVPLVDRQQLSSTYSARVESSGISINAGDTAAFQFTTPIRPAQFSLRSLTLATNADYSFTGTLELFDWRTQVWENVPFSLGNLPIPNPERFFSSTGVVRVRFRYKAMPTTGPSSVTFTRFQLLIGGAGR